MPGCLVRKSVAMPQFASVCNCSQNLAPSSKLLLTHLEDLWEGCRPPRGVANHWPTTFHCCRHEKSGRPASFSGMPTTCCCTSPVFCNREQERAWQCICKVCVHNHPPYHFISSRECGSRLSGHQSCISKRDGRDAK